MATDWQMPRRGETCSCCGRSFEPGDVMTACLYETPDGYERRDYCDACAVPDDPPTIAAWRTRRPPPAEKKTRAFDRATVWQFFERLEQPATPEQKQLRFVLALLLWRKKALKLKGSQAAPEGEVWHFVAPGDAATFAVLRPDLGEDELDRLGLQIETLLTGREAADDDAPPAAAAAEIAAEAGESNHG